MKTKIYPDIIFRTPKFSHQAELSVVWEELKDCIAISSTSFYEIIKDVKEEELEHLPQKTRFTIWKYFNRAKFRPTPYGTFASVGLMQDCISAGRSKIVIGKEQQLSKFIDWPYKNLLDRNLGEEIGNNCLIFSNSTYYKTKDALRYVFFTNNVFEISEIDTNELVEKVLEVCLVPTTVHEVISRLEIADEDIKDLRGVLVQMHSLQLIFTDKDPNSIGEDYFNRIGIENQTQHPTYILANRNAIEANLDNKLLQHLPKLVETLSKLIPFVERPPIANFISRFTRKFDQQEVPFSIALDPEMGVGYEDLEQAGVDENFVDQFGGRQAKPVEHLKFLKEELEKRLSSKEFSNREPINLNQLGIADANLTATIPNSISMLLSVVDDIIVAETIGGATANALAGRFTLGNEAIEKHCLTIAAIEEGANPDVIFFDVSYLAESDVDNINRRKRIYSHQLSILNFDTSEEPLTLNDLMISVRDGKIILRSKKYNKRCVPLMASAYNYSRSDLSAFRLLCDMQHHLVQTSLSFSLSSLFPNLNYYPRLQYHNIILNTAKWKIEKVKYLKDVSDKATVSLCRAFLKDLGISKYFKAGFGDQTLCFNLDNDNDIEAFIQFMSKKGDVYAEEVILPENNFITDENENPYYAQFNINMYHGEQVFKGIETEVSNKKKELKRVFLLGEEWLYFEIYCHEQRIDELLIAVIARIVSDYKSDIRRWFFIRYNENGNHIRFRIQLVNANDSEKITAALMLGLTPYITSNLVFDVQSKMYRREIERYGEAQIEQIEEHFFADSSFVIHFLSTQPSDFDKYAICEILVSKVFKAEIFDRKIVLQLVKQISDSFNKEHQLEAGDFKKLNEQYKQFLVHNANQLEPTIQHDFDVFSESLISVLEEATAEKRFGLFSSLVHMHVNRLFSKNQRSHEMILYYFLLKNMQRRKAMIAS